jgi:hypothetical protein
MSQSGPSENITDSDSTHNPPVRTLVESAPSQESPEDPSNLTTFNFASKPLNKIQKVMEKVEGLTSDIFELYMEGHKMKFTELKKAYRKRELLLQELKNLAPGYKPNSMLTFATFHTDPDR